MSSGNSNGFVRVMRSHDYNQFEVCLPLPESVATHIGKVDSAVLIDQIDGIRKDAARLVDKAVGQYDRMKRVVEMVNRLTGQEDGLRVDVREIMTVPEERRSPEQKAKVKMLSDFDHHRLRQAEGYRYDDDEPQFDDDPAF